LGRFLGSPRPFGLCFTTACHGEQASIATCDIFFDSAALAKGYEEGSRQLMERLAVMRTPEPRPDERVRPPGTRRTGLDGLENAPRALLRSSVSYLPPMVSALVERKTALRC